MTSPLRPVAAILGISLQAAFFRGPHRVLPDRVRLRSNGFMTLFAGFWAAGLLRHVVVAGLPLDVVTTNLVVYSVLVLAIAAARPTEVSLYLAASTGVDLSLATAGALGVLDPRDEMLRGFALAWEVAATVAAIVRRRADRRAGGG
jgi:hypothetical protein